MSKQDYLDRYKEIEQLLLNNSNQQSMSTLENLTKLWLNESKANFSRSANDEDKYNERLVELVASLGSEKDGTISEELKTLNSNIGHLLTYDSRCRQKADFEREQALARQREIKKRQEEEEEEARRKKEAEEEAERERQRLLRERMEREAAALAAKKLEKERREREEKEESERRQREAEEAEAKRKLLASVKVESSEKQADEEEDQAKNIAIDEDVDDDDDDDDDDDVPLVNLRRSRLMAKTAAGSSSPIRKDQQEPVNASPTTLTSKIFPL
jgi:hypothetical protein